MAAKKRLAVFEAGLATCRSLTHSPSNSLFRLAGQDDIATCEFLWGVIEPLAIATESYLFRKCLHISTGIQSYQTLNESFMDLKTIDVKGCCNVATQKLQIALEIKTALVNPESRHRVVYLAFTAKHRHSYNNAAWMLSLPRHRLVQIVEYLA